MIGKTKVEDDCCVICKTSQNFVGNMTQTEFLVNSTPECGHKFCETCIERSFSLKRQFACPSCQSMVKRTSLKKRSYDELKIFEDIPIRKRISEIFNKSQEDFLTHKEYCDYQEMTEDLIYNLTHGIDVEATEAQISLYETENMQSIRERKSRVVEENRRIETLIKYEKEAATKLAQEIQEQDLLEKQKEKLRKKQTYEVMLGERDTISSDLIGKQEMENKQPVSQFSRLMASAATGLDLINGTDNLMELQIAPSLLDLHRMQRLPPKVIRQDNNNFKSNNYQHINNHITYTAGGYNREVSFRKNWNETMSELKYHIDQQNSSTLSQLCSIWLHEWNQTS